jgi:hypothetical protein
MNICRQMALVASVALVAMSAIPAHASVTYVFIATSLQRSFGDNRDIPMPLSAPMGT